MELNKVVSNLAFRHASSLDGSAGHLPCALEATDSRLGAMRKKKKGVNVGRERDTHNWNPRSAEMERKLTVTRRRKRRQPKSKTLASKLPKNLMQSLQSVVMTSKILFDNWIDKALEEPEETSEKMKRGSPFKTLILTNWSTAWSTWWTFWLFIFLCIFSFCDLHLLFSVEIPNFLWPMRREFWFWSKFVHYLSICLYDAYDMKFMQSEGIFFKNSLRKH